MDQEKATQLPMSRIRTVMKTSPSIKQINQDALFLMCRAAELFIDFIARRAHKKGTKLLDYKHLATYVESEESLEFLVQILPKKITVSQYKKIMEQKKSKGTEDDDDSSSEDDSSSSGEESGDDDSDSSSGSGEEEDDDDEGNQKNDDTDSVISIDSSSSDEKENSKNMSNKKTPIKHKTGDSP